MANPEPTTAMGNLLGVLDFLWQNWEENWDCKKATDLNHLVAYKKADKGVNYTTLGELPFQKELLEAAMKKFKISEDYVIGQNLQRLRSILKGRTLSLKVSEKDMKTARKLFPETNLHNRPRRKKTVVRTALEVLKYFKENDLNNEKVDLNKITLSRRTPEGRRYTTLSELPFQKELIEGAIEKFGIDGEFNIGENLTYIRGAVSEGKGNKKVRQEDVEFAMEVFGLSKSEVGVEQSSTEKPVERTNAEQNYKSKYWQYVNNDPKQLDRMVQKVFFGSKDVNANKVFRELEILIRMEANRDKFDREIRIPYYIMREEILIAMRNRELTSNQVLENLRRKFGFDIIILKRVFAAMKEVSQAIQEERTRKMEETEKSKLVLPEERDAI